MTTWFTSDTHFTHPAIARIRGFTTVSEHDETIITRWNRQIRRDDIVWHLGDVGLGKQARVLELANRLNGRKQLVAGNHDPCWPGHRRSRTCQRQWLGVFESVQAFAKIRLDSREVLLSHLPYLGGGDHTEHERYTQFRLHDEGGWLIHGHTHQPDQADGVRSVHVGVDAWNLTPASEADIMRLMRAAEQQTAA